MKNLMWNAKSSPDQSGILNECQLGSVTLVSTPFPIDCHFVAIELGFSKAISNSSDAVTDTENYTTEFLSSASICIKHLLSLAEEMILWCNYSFKFIEFLDKVTTGNSIMPQKLNPNITGLIKAKTWNVFSVLTPYFVIMKGLPPTYNEDMQEDKTYFSYG